MPLELATRMQALCWALGSSCSRSVDALFWCPKVYYFVPPLPAPSMRGPFGSSYYSMFPSVLSSGTMLLFCWLTTYFKILIVIFKVFQKSLISQIRGLPATIRIWTFLSAHGCIHTQTHNSNYLYPRQMLNFFNGFKVVKN